jgi:NHLM bacteriocin system ABC transporter ATP-binding protein
LPEAVTLYRPLPEGKLGLLDLFKFPMLSRKRDLMLVLFTGVCATLLGMITPQATAILMDNAIPESDERLLWEIGAGLMAAALGRVIFSLSQSLILMRFGIGSEADTQSALWDRLLRLQPSFFRNYSSGDLQSRVMAVTQIGRELSGATISTVFSSFLALLNLGLLYYYSARLSILAVIVAVIVVAFSSTVSTFVRKKYRVLLELEGKFFGMVVQLITGVSKLKVAGAEGRAYAHWLKKYSKQLKLWAEADFLEDIIHVFNQTLPLLSSVVLYYMAFDLLMESRAAGGAGGMSLGIFLAFNTAFGTFIGGITSLSDTLVGLMDTAVQGKRVKPILEAEPEVDESKNDPGILSGRLEMSRVEFRYDPEGPKILDGVALRAEPGEFIALVGPSGCGKSTMFRLLLGFETPGAGEVSYDGQDLATLDVLAVRRQFGVVLQGGSLDSGSIFENIACGNVISLDEAWAAADDAGFGDEVRDMPMGMHTIVSVGGGNLSGGQRQRLLIARSLANRPRILLFDEATSALDNRTQAIVSRSLERLKVTRFVIAHRLSTIRNADRIYVLEGGKIVEHGRFAELMENDGLFSRLMARQMA